MANSNYIGLYRHSIWWDFK